ncbi:MFS transporter [Lederbergia sp. NSJ-179]|uniref:MFS transporter n=1 Tax=Lederbergia sp. NSJ-179 TaxID=2931402 RepID=UPI001FD3B7A7|nr:MFS transporter [Lederbergia sp. NSJ-179]MCJ7841547.1 MFS transporter [Lederbergia sp. NSJ-179]
MQANIAKKGPVITIAIITAISLLGNEMLFIVLPIYWKFFGLTALWQVGIILSMNRIIRLPINSVVGWCYQKISKRTGVLIAVILAIISTYSYGTLKGFWLLLVMRILWGISWSFLRLGGYLTVISSSTSQTRGELMGLYNGLWGLGTLFGILTGGLLAELIGIKWITTAFAILGALALPIVIRFIPNTLSEVKSNKKSDNNTSVLKNSHHLKILMNGLLVAFIVYGIFFSTISKLMEYQMEHNFLILGFSLGAAAIASLVQSIKLGSDPFVAPLVGKWSDLKFGRLPMLLFAFGVGTVLFMLLPVSFPFPLFLLLVFAFQIIATIFITTSDSIAVQAANGPNEVKVMTYYTLFVDLGSALGPLISYFVLDFIGLAWLYWLSSILLLMSFLYWSRVSRRQKKAQLAEIF